MKLNLAILLTMFRIAAIPLVVVCFYSTMPNARPIAAILFGVAAITDLLDGWVARKFGQMSRFGEFLDPVADKLMVAIVLVMLVQADPHWHVDIIAMIIIGREITISALREIDGVRGIHIMAIEWEEKVGRIVEAAGLLPRPAAD